MPLHAKERERELSEDYKISGPNAGNMGFKQHRAAVAAATCVECLTLGGI